MNGSILDCIEGHFTQFLDEHVTAAKDAALEDLKSRTRFVTLSHSNATYAVNCDVGTNVRLYRLCTPGCCCGKHSVRHRCRMLLCRRSSVSCKLALARRCRF